MGPDSFAAQSFLDAALASRPATDSSRALNTSDPSQAAAEFEAFFISQVINTIQSGPSLQSAFGGGPGEDAFKSFLSDAYAKAMVRAGGVGLADRLKAEIIALQAQSQPGDTPS